MHLHQFLGVQLFLLPPRQAVTAAASIDSTTDGPAWSCAATVMSV